MTRHKARATHTIPSGMGGVFDVRIVKTLLDGLAHVRVVTRNPDWDGHNLVVRAETLKPIGEPK